MERYSTAIGSFDRATLSCAALALLLSMGGASAAEGPEADKAEARSTHVELKWQAVQLNDLSAKDQPNDAQPRFQRLPPPKLAPMKAWTMPDGSTVVSHDRPLMIQPKPAAESATESPQ